MTNKQRAMMIGVVLIAVLTIAGIWCCAFFDISISLYEETTQATTTASTPAPTEPEQTTAMTTTGGEETTAAPVVVPPVKDKRIALTFDDGPSSAYTPLILDILAKYDAKATFFVVGYQLSSSKGAMLSRMVEEGHAIGNHSDNHPSTLTELSDEELLQEIEKVNQRIYELTGGYECTLLRPPGGNINGETLDRIYAGGLRMHTILWDSDTRDWESNAEYKNGEITEEEAIERAKSLALSQARDGSILLMHDIKEITPALLETLLETLSNEGYEFVTVNDLFDFESMGEDAYFSKFYAENYVTLLQ